jgi:hypothetical protein
MDLFSILEVHQDGAAAHTAVSALQMFYEFFDGRIISRNVLLSGSLDLSPLDL